VAVGSPELPANAAWHQQHCSYRSTVALAEPLRPAQPTYENRSRQDQGLSDHVCPVGRKLKNGQPELSDWLVRRTPVNSNQTIITAFGMTFVIGNALSLGMNLKVGDIVAGFFKEWAFAIRVLFINFVLLAGLIIGFAAIVHIPQDI
jgi:hypothetical protein